MAKLSFDIFADDQASAKFDNVATSLDKLDGKMKGSKSTHTDYGKGLDKVGEKADDLDTKAMGFRDTLTGVQDSMKGTSQIAKGDLFGGFLTLGMGIGDLGSGMYNFLVPALKATKIGTLASAAASKIAAVGSKVWAVASYVLGGALRFAMGPIGLVIIGIAALAVGLVYAYKHSEKFRAIVDAAFRAVGAVADWLWNKAIKPAFAAIYDAITGTLGWFKDLPGNIVGIFSKAGTWLVQKGKDVVTGLWNGLKNVWTTTLDWITGLGGKIVAVYVKAGTWLYEGGRRILTGLWDGLKNVWTSTRDWFTGMGGRIIGFYAQAGTWLYSKGKDIITGLWNGLKNVWSSTKDWVGGIGGAIIGKLASADRWLYQKGRDVLLGFWDGLKNVWESVTGWISGLTGWIKDHKGPPSLDRGLLVQAGKDIMGGFYRGLKDGGLKALGFVEGVAGKVTGLVTGPVVSGSNVAIGQMLAARYGWTGGQWDALRTLWQNESGWSNTAQNPTSTAYGIAQFLNSTWGTVGASKTSDPVGQISAGLRYIQQSYGSPANALNQWMSRSPHWYGSGMAPTVFSRPTLIGVGERGAETVTVTPHGRGAGAGGQALVVQLVVDGRVLQQSLLRLKDGNGGIALGLA